MDYLSKVKYFLITFFSGFLLIASPVFAAANPNATKSNELKVQMCQAKEKVLETRMGNLLRMANTMLEVFGKIDNRVEEFYKNKVVANGKSVQNYDALVKAVQDKKDVVKVSLDQATADSKKFDCSAEKPKDALLAFRKDMQIVKSALKDYRTSIKNLIVAVKSVTSTLEKENLSGTPKPTKALEQE